MRWPFHRVDIIQHGVAIIYQAFGDIGAGAQVMIHLYAAHIGLAAVLVNVIEQDDFPQFTATIVIFGYGAEARILVDIDVIITESLRLIHL